MTSRQQLAAFLDRPRTRNVITAVILFNAVLLGLETIDPVMRLAGGLIAALDRLCLAFFTLEISAKLYAHRLRFFRSGWNIFDFAVVDHLGNHRSVDAEFAGEAEGGAYFIQFDPGRRAEIREDIQ